MTNEINIKNGPGENMIYQIRIKGHLSAGWAQWFGGATITLEDDGDTLLNGPLVDQAALHGLLKKLRNLGMPLISVNTIEPDSRPRSGQVEAPVHND